MGASADGIMEGLERELEEQRQARANLQERVQQVRTRLGDRGLWARTSDACLCIEAWDTCVYSARLQVGERICEDLDARMWMRQDLREVASHVCASIHGRV